MSLRLFKAVVLLSAVIIINGNPTPDLSQKPVDFWNEAEPFGAKGPPSPDLRLPSDVVPSFYRLKIRADLDNSRFKGDVYITIRANKNVKEIVLHSKDLSINNNAKLTEQIYEKVETLHTRRKREINETTPENNATVTDTSVNFVNETELSEITNNTELSINNTNVSVDNTNASINNTEIKTNNTEISTNNTELRTNNVEDNINDTEVGNTSTIVTELPSMETPISNNTDVPTLNDFAYTVTSIDTQVTHSSVRNIDIVSITKGTGDRLILTLASALKTEVDYTLQLSFDGKISNALTGFYKSTYTNNDQQVKSLGVTQFEPTSARAAFPCFDEPAFKAKFEISIAHASNLTALSNMKVAAEEDITDEPGWKWTHFERSVNMSTYLVAYIISDFKASETSYVSKDNVTKPIKIWTRPELVSKAKYALSITPKLLTYYEDVFGVPYALDKLDLVAVPDFSSGAMENWGLITFRETTLLFDPVEGVPRDKQNVAIDIAHELAHQWFGNLVTMRWWTDLWLNEGFASYIEYVGVDHGFASYIEYVGVDHIEPEWNMLETFSNDKMDLLRTDALKNTSPVSRQVVDASEISQKFDEISYTKGSNLIRMLNHTISEKLFHKGLLIYLNNWKYRNAEENDLWSAMAAGAEAAGEKGAGQGAGARGVSLVRFMNSWTRQPGYPALTVQRDYDTGDVKFEQKLYTMSKEPYQSMVDQLWQIPISYTAMDAPFSEWSAKPKLWLTDRSMVANVEVNGTQALYVNVDAIGYYRVNYDKKNWELLISALKKGYYKSPITKAQLIDDAFNLAKASQLNYSLALGLTTCVIDGEDSKTVWDILLNNMAFLKYNIRKTSGYMYFQDYLKIMIQKQLERVNFGLSKPKDDNEAFLMENLVMWECEVETPRCVQWVRGQFDQWMQQHDYNNNTIPNHLRSLVYAMALRYGGRREFDFLWRVFQNASDPNVKSLAINNLPSTRDPALVNLLLEKSITDLPTQYASIVWSVDTSMTRVARDFLFAHFDAVYSRFTEADEFTFPSVLNGAFGFITNTDELDKLKKFALEHKEKLLPMSQTLQKLVDTATLRIDWIARHANTIQKWLKDYVTNHAKGNSTEATTTVETSKQTENQNLTQNVTEKPNLMRSGNEDANPIQNDNANPNSTQNGNVNPNSTQNGNVKTEKDIDLEQNVNENPNTTAKVTDSPNLMENVNENPNATENVNSSQVKVTEVTP